MANNALLYNAAYTGFLGGLIAGQYLTSTTAGDYALLVTQATQFATELDSLIANDNAGTPVPAGTVAITVITTGVAIAPSTGPIYESGLGKTSLIQQLSYAFAFQRYATGQLAASFAGVCAAIRVAYLAAAPGLVTP